MLKIFKKGITRKKFRFIVFILLIIQQKSFADYLSFELKVINHSGHDLKFYISKNTYKTSICDTLNQDIRNNDTITLTNYIKNPINTEPFLGCEFRYLLEDNRTVYSISIMNLFQNSIINTDPILSYNSYVGYYSSFHSATGYSDEAILKTIEYYPLNKSCEFCLNSKSAEIEIIPTNVKIINP